mmetsp:Transcript_16923/g.26404  ORF Transcript_16923/g.26404 Transcript_16923/m.26404 type:complete len:305 (+) Transcript_16923:84-998(+)
MDDGGFLQSISQALESYTGIEGILGYLVIASCVFLGHWVMNKLTERHLEEEGRKEASKKGIAHKLDSDNADEEPEPPRNFTAEQLKYFDGKVDEKTDENKPVYLSVNGTVFDVSDGRDFYGPGGPYELFAGHECGVALAKFSFDTTHLDDMAGCENLNFGEKEELDNWIQKFTYHRLYPVKGRLIPQDMLPDPNRLVTKSELEANNGEGEIPKGYAAAPIYVGAGEKCYDMSFGGIQFYGPGCGYNRFAGKDVSRALAKMSFEPSDTENTDVSDLSEKELKVLADWIKTFEDRKKYPCVGHVEK